MVIIVFIIMIICYIIYRFCEVASNSDSQKLEDELFLKTHRQESKNED